MEKRTRQKGKTDFLSINNRVEFVLHFENRELVNVSS